MINGDINQVLIIIKYFSIEETVMTVIECLFLRKKCMKDIGLLCCTIYFFTHVKPNKNDPNLTRSLTTSGIVARSSEVTSCLSGKRTTLTSSSYCSCSTSNPPSIPETHRYTECEHHLKITKLMNVTLYSWLLKKKKQCQSLIGN